MTTGEDFRLPFLNATFTAAPEAETDQAAPDRLGHSDAKVTRRVYRRLPKIAQPAALPTRKWSPMAVLVTKPPTPSKPAALDQGCTPLQASRCVHLQERDRRSASGGAPHQLHAAQLEVPTPSVPTWVEQRDHLPRLGIYAAEIGALVVITSMACPCKVLENSLTAVLAGDDVLEMEGLERWPPVRQMAIFAALASPLSSFLAWRRAHLIRAVASGVRLLGAASRGCRPVR